jgi:hypothetical protein
MRASAPAAKIWRKLEPGGWIEVISDDETPELAAVVHRITQQPLQQRRRHAKDFGELMVVAHAVVAAQAGETVTVLIDDGSGAERPPRKEGDWSGSAAEAGRSDRLSS